MSDASVRTADESLTIGLSAEMVDESRHQGRHPYTVQYGHTNVDTMAAKLSAGSGHDGAVVAGGDPPVTDDWKPRFGGGGQGATASNRKQGQAQSTALSSDTDGQNMPSSRYQVDIRWSWTALRGDTELPAAEGQTRQVDAQATLLQPDELHEKAGAPALPNLTEVPAPVTGPSRASASILARMGTAIYTAVGVRGIGALQQAMIDRGANLSRVSVWGGLTPTVYKTALIRGCRAPRPCRSGPRRLPLPPFRSGVRRS